MPGVTRAPLTVTPWPSMGTVPGMMLACTMPSPLMVVMVRARSSAFSRDMALASRRISG